MLTKINQSKKRDAPPSTRQPVQGGATLADWTAAELLLRDATNQVLLKSQAVQCRNLPLRTSSDVCNTTRGGWRGKPRPQWTKKGRVEARGDSGGPSRQGLWQDMPSRAYHLSEGSSMLLHCRFSCVRVVFSMFSLLHFGFGPRCSSRYARRRAGGRSGRASIRIFGCTCRGMRGVASATAGAVDVPDNSRL